jgi:hypothetical protein
VAPLSNDAKHPIAPPPQKRTDSASSTVHLGCAQNQTAPPKCKSKDGAGSTTTCSTRNEIDGCAQGVVHPTVELSSRSRSSAKEPILCDPTHNHTTDRLLLLNSMLES